MIEERVSAEAKFGDGSRAKKKLLLDDVRAQREFLRFFDPRFEESVLWVKEGQTVCIKGSIHVPAYRIDSTTDANPESAATKTASWFRGTLEGRPNDGRCFGNPAFYEYARNWISERSKIIFHKPPEPIVLYHVRGEWASGRVMDGDNDALLRQSLREKLDACGRPEKIVFFNGRNEQGEELSQKEQFTLFYSASLFVGPHSGGVAAIIFMMGTLKGDTFTCQSRPQVLEYIPGPRSAQVHWAFASYYSLYFGAPWVEYHLVQFTANSTHEVTYVGIDDWEAAMGAIFAGNRCPANLS